ncbi:hypothetical protein EGT74_10600 [Chitinophaga lutea]|uniref:Uncharacterized protein n=2 Tax=Chitinophaga lutea TaxID=2488634 RepID=A0A3N4QQS9_9BACT|nr:hypothetical protein EGT74_10600 [Chitinophaga lutea]
MGGAMFVEKVGAPFIFKWMNKKAFAGFSIISFRFFTPVHEMTTFHPVNEEISSFVNIHTIVSLQTIA